MTPLSPAPGRRGARGGGRVVDELLIYITTPYTGAVPRLIFYEHADSFFPFALPPKRDRKLILVGDLNPRIDERVCGVTV